MSSKRYVKKLSSTFEQLSVSKPIVRDNRTEIFENKVADKDLIQRNKLKTAMCKRMVETGSCNYGASCFFAHTKEELRKPICFFKEECKNKDTCPYDHTTEVIPEMIPPPQQPQKEQFKIELEPVESFYVDSKTFCPDLEKLKSLMYQSENNVEFQRVLTDTLKEFMTNTFTKENTHYIPSKSGHKNIKFIAVECDDEDFQTLKEIINDSFEEEN